VPRRRSLDFEDKAVCRSFGERLRHVRQDAGLTQQELARQAVGAASEPDQPDHLDRAFLNRIERGQANPSLVTIHRLARALGVPILDLFVGVQAD
jgi:transcriptional regulator with XRE-family HTH domain